MPVAVLAALLMAATAQTPQDVSIERLRERLQKPPLKMPSDAETPTFRVRIEQDYPVETVLEMIRREIGELPAPPGRSLPKTATASGAQPLAGVDLLEVYGSIRKAFRAADERQARREVEDALKAFCAVRDCTKLEEAPPK